MNLNNLFVFGTNFSTATISVSNKESDWDTNCRILRGVFTGVDFPVEFKQSHCSNWMDVLNPVSVGMYIVFKRLTELFEQNDITGWKTYPITLLDKEGKGASGYFGFSILGKCVLETLKVNKYDRTYQIWKREPLSIELFTEKTFMLKLQYIHQNPVKAGLVNFAETYKYYRLNFIYLVLMNLIL